MTTRRRRRPARKGMGLATFLRVVGLGCCLLFLSAGNLPSLALVGSVLLFSYRPARRAVLIAGCVAGLLGLFALVVWAMRKDHRWTNLGSPFRPDDRHGWGRYLRDAPPPRRPAQRRPPAQRYVTRPLPAVPPPAPRDPWSAPTVRLSRPAVAR